MNRQLSSPSCGRAPASMSAASSYEPPVTYSALVYADPLAEDQSDDDLIVLTNRQWMRLVFVAAETGARFQREGIDVDPIDWLSAPRRVFDNRCALKACTELPSFVRALILHGLSIGLDASPEDLDGLLADEPDHVSAIRQPLSKRDASRLSPVPA